MTNLRIFIAGHKGMVGSALIRLLQEQKNIEITGSSATYRVNRLATEVVKHFMGQ